MSDDQFIAGFADGSLQMYDKRMDEKAVVGTFMRHEAWVQKVKLHPQDQWQFMSARYVVCFVPPPLFCIPECEMEYISCFCGFRRICL
jgi:hypothetical protein